MSAITRRPPLNDQLIDQLDRILDELQPTLAQLAAEHRLEPHALERWHWDAPEISLSWLDERAGLINKSLRFYVDLRQGESFPPFVVRAEINAWQDLDAIGGALRRWRHQTVEGALLLTGVEDVKSRVFEVIELRDRGYRVVSGWTVEDLTRTEHLPPLTVGAVISPQSPQG
jgi:hypothetical protein